MPIYKNENIKQLKSNPLIDILHETRRNPQGFYHNFYKYLSYRGKKYLDRFPRSLLDEGGALNLGIIVPEGLSFVHEVNILSRVSFSKDVPPGEPTMPNEPTIGVNIPPSYDLIYQNRNGAHRYKPVSNKAQELFLPYRGLCLSDGFFEVFEKDHKALYNSGLGIVVLNPNLDKICSELLKNPMTPLKEESSRDPDGAPVPLPQKSPNRYETLGYTPNPWGEH